MSVDTLWEYDTRVWRQELRTESGRWRLTRRIKESRADDTSRRELAATRLAGQPSAAAVRFVPPEYTVEGAIYELTAPDVLASLLWPQVTVTPAVLTTLMDRLGTAVAEVHSAGPAPDSVSGLESPHLRRLAAHLSAGTATFAGLVVVQQQPAAIERLRRWLAEIPREGVLCHGGLTLGSVFVDHDVDGVEIPAGDELMASAGELDLAWVVGELTEFEYLAATRGTDGSAYADAAAVLLRAWSRRAGREPSTALLQRIVALRYLLHLCDYAETTQSTDTGSTNAPFLTWLVERADATPLNERIAL